MIMHWLPCSVHQGNSDLFSVSAGQGCAARFNECKPLKMSHAKLALFARLPDGARSEKTRMALFEAFLALPKIRDPYVMEQLFAKDRPARFIDSA